MLLVYELQLLLLLFTLILLFFLVIGEEIFFFADFKLFIFLGIKSKEKFSDVKVFNIKFLFSSKIFFNSN